MYLQTSRGEGADKHHSLGVLGDVDEAPTAWRTVCKAADVHISAGIRLHFESSSHHKSVQPLQQSQAAKSQRMHVEQALLSR